MLGKLTAHLDMSITNLIRVLLKLVDHVECATELGDVWSDKVDISLDRLQQNRQNQASDVGGVRLGSQKVAILPSIRLC
jgi:hypothetical protein